LKEATEMSNSLFDETDRKVLNYLQDHGRVSNQELAGALHLSTSACWRRVKSLEDSGVIVGYNALLDPDECGMSFHAMVHVSLTKHSGPHVEKFVNEIMAKPEVLDCFATAGDPDYHLRVRCRNLDHYNRFLESFLTDLNGVSSVRTNLILKQIKHSSALLL
jgi:Lrp/AsnC family leucine-responsive transcriptional regulator